MTSPLKSKVRCTYFDTCYIAEGAQCFGYKKDCPLYKKSNGESIDPAQFHAAMDQLIFDVRTRHLSKKSKD